MFIRDYKILAESGPYFNSASFDTRKVWQKTERTISVSGSFFENQENIVYRIFFMIGQGFKI